MKKFSILGLRASKVIASLAFAFMFYSANTCCALYAYQPELPEGAEKFKKF